ncbi:MAG: helix-turn-helix domain-containing protein [Eubacterium sp.]|nr:helix-turn-helix domain-containing protein [Eubacterium sp.]
MVAIGQMIKEKRVAAGMSQKKLGVACGVSDSEIMKIENGKRKTPNWDILCKIAKVLKFHPFEILLAAGYITEEDINYTNRLHGIVSLTESELSDVQQYIDFTLSKERSDKISKEDA